VDGQRRKVLPEKYGLDVEIINVRGSSIGIAGLVSGEFQYFVMGATSPVSAAGQGIDLVAVMSMSNPNFVLIGRPEFQSPADLKGKTIAMGDIGGINDFAVAEGLKNSALEWTSTRGGLAATSRHGLTACWPDSSMLRS
jgi:ABC-type nitrate/sulfonate/bicarbonate transport system substrate-binding protein